MAHGVVTQTLKSVHGIVSEVSSQRLPDLGIGIPREVLMGLRDERVRPAQSNSLGLWNLDCGPLSLLFLPVSVNLHTD